MRRKGLAVPLSFPKAAARAVARFGLDRPGPDLFPTCDHLRPMLLTVGREPFNDPAWVYEPKWDGFRIIAAVQNGTVRLLSRNLHTLTDRFRPVAEALPAFSSLTRGDLELWISGPDSSAARAMPDGRRPEPGGWNRVVVQVEDLSSTVVEMQTAGVRCRNEIVTGPGGKQIVIEDPFGNPVELFEPAR